MSGPDPRARPELGLAAWLETIGYVGARLGSTRLERSGSCWLGVENHELVNPFPRQFRHTRSVYAMRGDPRKIVGEVETLLDSPGEEHVLHVFGRDADVIAAEFAPHGYALTWSYSLFGFELGPDRPGPEPGPGLELRAVNSLDEIRAINETDPPYPSHAELFGDPHVYEAMVFEDGRPIAKGHIVTSVPGVVHVLGMFTLPERRRRGLARVIIEALHREARARGASWSVLNASLEAARADVYPRLGYETLLRAARLIPEHRGRV